MAQSAYKAESTVQLDKCAIAHGTAGTPDALPDTEAGSRFNQSGAARSSRRCL
jgi:hypothetical protein